MKDFYDFLNSGISDELLAAYIDGNTTETENQLIENSLNGDSMLSEAYEIAHGGVSFESNFDWDLHKGDFGFWELGLPPVVTEADLTIAADTSYGNTTNEGADFNPNLDTLNPLDDGFTPLDTSTLDDLLNSDISEGLEDVDDLGNTLL
ncbi:hypothetical protein [Pseudobutyrivibrio sp.]